MSRGLYLVSLRYFIGTSTGWSAELPVPSSAEFCGDCHRAIEEGWKQSAHSQAVESRLFQDAMKLAETDYGASARKTCLSCHSPIAVESGDLALVKKVSWEGITCDYCHSIRDVTLTGPNPKATVDYSLVKSGPWKDVNSPAHGTVFSACAHFLADLRFLPRIPQFAGVSSSDHLLGVEQERVRRKESKLPVVPHVPSAGERRGPARPKDRPSRHQSPSDSGQPLDAAVGKGPPRGAFRHARGRPAARSLWKSRIGVQGTPCRRVLPCGS